MPIVGAQNHTGASSFLIQELGADKRSLRLVDRALPYRPFELHTKQRLETTWYPGNPEATATVLGPAEEPTSINGKWKDKYISNDILTPGDLSEAQLNLSRVRVTQLAPITVDGTPVSSVRDAVFIVDDIIRKGQLLEVSWDDQTRRGHMVDFIKRWENAHDLEWEMRFEWISRGEPVPESVFPEETSAFDLSSQLRENNAQLQSDADFLIATQSTFQEDLLSFLATIDDQVNTAIDTANQFANNIITPFDVARRLIANCTSIIGATRDLIDFLEYRIFGDGNFHPVEQQSYSERLVSTVYSRTLIQDARNLFRLASIRRSTLSSQIESDLLGTYTARDGDDLRDVAFQFYESAYEWRRLMLFNQLTSAELVAGQLILIPKASTTNNAV